jgi:putative ABC transport system ATP-binding protein
MIQVENVTKTHRRGDVQIPVLRGMNCSIPTGKFTFIVGPSGSGKSTLLYLLGALDEPTSGRILVEGRDVVAMSASERDAFRQKDVGFIFQNFNLIANLDAVGNVLVPFMPKGLSDEQRAAARELLIRVGLGHRLDHKPAHLSGGEQQRVAIARALLKRPMLILADEPTGELDSKTGAEIFQYLRELQEERGSTVVIVTHDHRYIRPEDNVLEIGDGVIVSPSRPQ